MVPADVQQTDKYRKAEKRRAAKADVPDVLHQAHVASVRFRELTPVVQKSNTVYLEAPSFIFNMVARQPSPT